MNEAYEQGRAARTLGYSRVYCPHGQQPTKWDGSDHDRRQSPLVKRHWWLAGWHDRDMEMGGSVIEGAA